MRRSSKKAAIAIAAIVIAAALLPLSAFASQLTVSSLPDDALEASETHNLWKHDYVRNGHFRNTFWTQPAASYLHVNGQGALERVEYADGRLVVEEVNADLKGISSQKVIDADTYRVSFNGSSGAFVWGGFFSGATDNFVATGWQVDASGSDQPVYRISKYSKAWELESSCEIGGIDTVEAISDGFLDMCEHDGKLYVRTSQQQAFGNEVHQTNVQFVINEADMQAVNYGETGSANWSNATDFVSHSFNQLLVTLGEKVYGMDHGDGNPRSVCVKDLLDYTAEHVDVFPIEGPYANYTGVKLGGLESSASENTLVSVCSSTNQELQKANSTDKNVWTSNEANVYAAITSASDLSSRIVKLTDYRDEDGEGHEEPGTVTPSAPFLVKVSDDKFRGFGSLCDKGLA